MKKLVCVLVLGLMWAGVAWAQPSCTVTQLSPGPVTIPNEGANPATSDPLHAILAYNDSTGLVLRNTGDGGNSWASRVFDENGDDPRFVALGPVVYAAWQRATSPGHASQMAAMSADYGNSWTQPQVLGDVVPASETQIAVSASGPVIAFIPPGRASVEVWANGTVTSLPSISPSAQEISIAAFGNNVGVVWAVGEDEGNVSEFSMSSDGGSTFSNPVVLTPAGQEWREPLLTVGPDGTLWLAARMDKVDGHGRASAAFIMASSNFGASWSPQEWVYESSDRERQVSSVVADGKLMVGFMENEADGWHAMMTTSPDGATYTKPIDYGTTGIFGSDIGGEDHQVRMSNQAGFRAVYVLAPENVYTRTGPRAVPVLLGPGYDPQVAGDFVLYKGPGDAAMIGVCGITPNKGK